MRISTFLKIMNYLQLSNLYQTQAKKQITQDIIEKRIASIFREDYRIGILGVSRSLVAHSFGLVLYMLLCAANKTPIKESITRSTNIRFLYTCG